MGHLGLQDCSFSVEIAIPQLLVFLDDVSARYCTAALGMTQGLRVDDAAGC